MLITSIPQELIEHTLVIATQDGYAATVSSLSQTCKHFHHFLGVKADNRHLWRHLFLAMFEDPQQPDGGFDWKKEFVGRIQTRKWFRRWTAVGGKKNEVMMKDEKEEEIRLLHSLRTLVKSVTTENSPMNSDFFSLLKVDSDDTILFGAPLSDTHLAYPLLIVLHAFLAQKRNARERSTYFSFPSPLSFKDEESWGNILLDSLKSSTSAWAEGVLKHGYPPALAERLRTFDPWIYRCSISPSRARARARTRPHPFSTASTGEGKGKSSQSNTRLHPFTHTGITADPTWELTETGRLFYKLVLIKGYLPDRSIVPHKSLLVQKREARTLARRRVYDMRYLSRERLFGPFLPVGRRLEFGLREGEGENGKTPPKCKQHAQSAQVAGSRSATGEDEDGSGSEYVPLHEAAYPSHSSSSSSSSSSASSAFSDDDDSFSDDDETTQLHLDMITLFTAGIHPHLLIHHHLFQHDFPDDDGPAAAHIANNAGGSGANQVPTQPNNASDNAGGRVREIIDPFKLVETYPHRIVPDYAFLSAARLLIEMDMKDAWGSLMSLGGHGFEDESDDEDDDDDDESDTSDDESHDSGDHDGGNNEDDQDDEEYHRAPSPHSRHSSPNYYTASSQASSSIHSLPTMSRSSISSLSSHASNSPPLDHGPNPQPHIDAHPSDGIPPSLMVNISRDTRRWVERLVEAFSALDFVRMGGAVGYWRNNQLNENGRGRWWVRGSGTRPESGLRGLARSEGGNKTNSEGKGKGKERAKESKEEEKETYEGWDWAGVEGEWRRVVCWMDYQDLLLHSSGGPSIGFDEAIRLFPIKLHVTGYSPPPAFPASPSSPPPSSLPPSQPIASSSRTDGGLPAPTQEVIRDESTNPDALIWHLPVIHFAGESRLPESILGGDGSHADADDDADGQTPGMVRGIRGTVRMIGDGAVWWSMTSSHVNQSESEWAMEGVQVGCIGSAVGVVGMWTGAGHARGDPIGPCWQWKVG